MAKPNTKSLELPNSLRLLKSSHKVYDQYGGNARTASALSHRDHFSINMLYNCAGKLPSMLSANCCHSTLIKVAASNLTEEGLP